MASTRDKFLVKSIGALRMRKRTGSLSVPYPRFPQMSRPVRIRLLIVSLALNLILGAGVWWHAIGRPNEDAAELIDVTSRLASLDREAAAGGFSSSQQPAITERRSILLAEVEPALRRLGERANPELLGVIVNSYERQGDYARAIEFGRAMAESPTASLALRINAYKALGHLYLNEIGGSPAEANKSFAAALDLIQENEDPQSWAVAASIDMDWANVLVQLGQINDAFLRLLQGRQQVIGLACGFFERNRLLAIVTNGLQTLAAQDDARADGLRAAITDHPDLCSANR